MTEGPLSLSDLIEQLDISQHYEKLVACFEVAGMGANVLSKEPRSLDCFMALLVNKGEARCFITYEERCVKEGDLMLLSPHTLVFLTSISADFSGFCIFFDALAFGLSVQARQIPVHLTIEQRPLLLMTLKQEEHDALLLTMRALSRHITLPGSHQEDILSNLARAIFLQMLDLSPESPEKPIIVTRTQQLLARFFELVIQHFRHEHTIKFYSSRLSITPAYLSRIVRQTLNHTVAYYISGLLYREACYLLRHTDLTIGEIAFRLNYSDLSAFGKFFKQRSGMSPQLYRQKRHPI